MECCPANFVSHMNISTMFEQFFCGRELSMLPDVVRRVFRYIVLPGRRRVLLRAVLCRDNHRMMRNGVV